MADTRHMHLEDEEVLTAVEVDAAGEAARPAFAEVYRAEADFVWRTLGRLGVWEADRKDMTQEVFIVANRRWSSFRSEGSMRAWLFGIARRVAASYRRRAHRRHEQSVPVVPEGIGGAAQEDVVAAREAEVQLAAILDRMNLDQRAVFVMFEMDGMMCQEIAEVTGVPIGTVYSRLAAARKRFEAELARLALKDARGRR